MNALGGALEWVTGNPNNLVIVLPSAIYHASGLLTAAPSLGSFQRGRAFSLEVLKWELLKFVKVARSIVM